MKRGIALVLALLLAPLAWAADPPGRVGRLALVEGEASTFADPDLGWEPARVNSPLTSQNSVWTEPASRAEVRFDATALRLGELTQLDIVRLDDEAFHAHLPRGALAITIRHLDPREAFAITTATARFQLRAAGRYRVDADPDRGESRLTVLAGNARLEVAGGYVNVDGGRAVRVSAGSGNGTRFEFEGARGSPLDDWSLDRDRRYENRESARYVPPQMTGWEDLDDYGSWRNEPDYGPVWYPARVEPGWAPYRYGRWVWVRPWGWSWVDDAPWGYAPFHYGRWIFTGGRWGWYPGAYTARTIWAPALVGWIGGPGWSVSLATGAANVVGWYPLSPYDAYQPWYAANVTYVTNINRIVRPPRHDRDHRDDRHDPRRPGDRGGDRHDNRDRGATVMPREHFGTHRPVQSVIAPVAGEAVRGQPVVSGTTVLPSKPDWQGRGRPPESTRAPRSPAGGEPVARPAPVTKPAPAYPAPQVAAPPASAAPTAPSMPSAPASRATRPAPAEAASRTVVPEPTPKPVTPEAASRVSPSQPVPRYKPGEQPGRVLPADSLSKPLPVEPAQAPRPAAPQQAPAPATPKPVPAPAVEKPAVAKPAPQADKPAPASKPAPAPERKGPESAPRPVEKPGRGPEKESGG